MAWADEIVGHNTLITSLQNKIDFIEGNTATFFAGRTDEPKERTAAGATGYLTAWRTDNASADGSNGDADTNHLYNMWNYQVNSVDAEGTVAGSKTSAEIIVALKAERDTIITDRDALQAKIDGGTATDSGVEV